MVQMQTGEVTFAAYSVKASGQRQKPEPLGSVLGHVDVADLLDEFVQARQNQLQDDSGSQELQQFSAAERTERRITGYVLNGTYGRRGTIMRRNHGKVFDKTRDDADMLRFYFSAYIPAESPTGILVVQTQGNSGIVNVFQRDFARFASGKHSDIAVRVHRVAPSNYVQAILGDGAVKSIRFVKYKPSPDLAKRLEQFGVAEQCGSIELEIRPKRGLTFALYGSLVKRLNGNRGDDGIAELAGPDWQPDRTLVTVDLNGRSRTLKVDTLGIGRPDIVAHLPVSPDDGLTDTAELDKYAQELTNDLLRALQVGP